MANYNGVIQVNLSWANFKSTVSLKKIPIQFDETATAYDVFALDGNIAYTLTIFRGAVPNTIDYNQSQNDADKTDFETNYKNIVTNRASSIAAAVDGYAITTTNPSLIAGSDGTNIKTILVDGTGRLSTINASTLTVGTSTPTSATNIGGSVTTAAPTYTTGTFNSLSLNTSGALRVDSSGANQVVTGNATDNTTNVTTKLPVMAAVAATASPTWTSGNMVPLSVDTSGALRITGSIGANASVSATGSAPPASATYIGGSVTTAAPAYTTGQMSALSLATNGNLRTQSASESATGAATTSIASLVGGTDGTNLRAFRTFTDGTLQTKSREVATFTALATATAPANNKSMWSIENTSGSTVKVKIQEIYLVNVLNSAAIGVSITFDIRRAVSHSIGVSITAIESMETSDTLNSSVTVRTGATIATPSANLLWRNTWSSDEWGPGAADVESADHSFQTMFPIYSRKTADTKPITLAAAQALTINCVTNTTVGSFDLIVVFTQE